jgi:hypothetical protein
MANLSELPANQIPMVEEGVIFTLVNLAYSHNDEVHRSQPSLSYAYAYASPLYITLIFSI